MEGLGFMFSVGQLVYHKANGMPVLILSRSWHEYGVDLTYRDYSGRVGSHDSLSLQSAVFTECELSAEPVHSPAIPPSVMAEVLDLLKKPAK